MEDLEPKVVEPTAETAAPVTPAPAAAISSAPETPGDNEVDGGKTIVESPLPPPLTAEEREEHLGRARENIKLAGEFVQREELAQALDAYETALDLFQRAYGEELAPERATLYLKYGRVLSRYTTETLDDATKRAMLEVLHRNAETPEGEDAPKVSASAVEEQVASHAEGYDDAFEAFEYARLIFKTNGDELGVSDACLELGDLCMTLEDWDVAVQEYTNCATIRTALLGANRVTAEPYYLLAVIQEALGNRDEALAACQTARDTMAAAIAQSDKSPDDPELTQMREVLTSMEEKLAEIAAGRAPAADEDGDNVEGDDLGGPEEVDEMDFVQDEEEQQQPQSPGGKRERDDDAAEPESKVAKTAE